MAHTFMHSNVTHLQSKFFFPALIPLTKIQMKNLAGKKLTLQKSKYEPFFEVTRKFGHWKIWIFERNFTVGRGKIVWSKLQVSASLADPRKSHLKKIHITPNPSKLNVKL
jgi:hypothetical protein